MRLKIYVYRVVTEKSDILSSVFLRKNMIKKELQIGLQKLPNISEDIA